MISILGTFVIVIAAVLPSTQFAPDSAIKQTVIIYRHGDIDRAIDIANRLIAKYPDDPRSYINKGIFIRQVALMENKPVLFDVALGVFTNARIHATDRQTMVIIEGNIATTLLEKGDFSAALVSYKECYRLTGRLFYRVRGAYALARLGKLTEALDIVGEMSVQQILTADTPGNEGLTAYNVGVVYAMAGKPIPAVQWLRIAESLDPVAHDVGFTRGTDLNSIRKSLEFKQFINEAVPR